MPLSRVGRHLTAKLQSSSGLTLALFSLTLFIGEVLYGSVGLRGTDQYWYVGDLRMSTITDLAVTNSIYPTATGPSANTSINGLPPRIHNLPVTYLASLAHQAGASEYLAWVYVNFALALVIAVSVFFVARNHGYHYAYLAPALFLFFPLTLWLSINALAEMSLALGSCLIMLGATVVSRTVLDTGRKVSFGLVIIAAGSIVMFYTRDNYVLLFPALVIFTFWVCRSDRRRWIQAAPVLGITALLAALKHVLLPQYPSAGLLSQLMIGTPSGGEAMTQYYRLGSVSFSVSEVTRKATIGLRDALFPSGGAELITEVPIILIIIVALFVFRKDSNTRLLRFWMVVVGVIYLITSASFAAQNRYIFALVPFVAVFGAGLWDRFIPHGAAYGWLTKALRIASVCFLIVCIFGSFLMARAYRMEATSEVAMTSRLIAGLANEPGGSVLAVAGSFKLLPLTYAAVPRPVLAVDPRFNSIADAALLIKTWRVRVLVGSNGKDLQYLSRAVDFAFAGRAKVIAHPSYATPGGMIRVWLIEPASSSRSENQRGS